MVETLGGWGDMALAVLNILATRLADRNGRKRSDEKKHLLERLSVQLQRSNAEMFLKRQGFVWKWGWL